MSCLILLLLLGVTLPEGGAQEQLFHIDFHQHDYDIILQRMEVVRYSKHYVNDARIKTFKYNRTCTAFNITLNVNCEAEKTEIVAQAYKFLSNEYRLFPLRVEYNACKALAQNFAGIGTFPCGNYTGCSMLKGQTYIICNWTVDPSQFPPRIPSGQYMIEYQFVYHSDEIALIRTYGAVTRPEVRK